MRKLHSLVFCALVTPALALGASSVLAQQSTGQQGMERAPAGQAYDRGQKGMQREHDMKGDGSLTGTDMHNMRDPSRTEHRGYLTSAPADGLKASNLIGANVRTAGDEDVGSVSDLILDKDGQIVGVIVGVGGFLGMGETDVAIGWDDVTRSGTPDDPELRVDVTEDDLRSAPKFEMRD